MPRKSKSRRNFPGKFFDPQLAERNFYRQKITPDFSQQGSNVETKTLVEIEVRIDQIISNG